MSEKVPHSKTQETHEALYRRTVRTALEGIEQGAYTESGAARVLSDLRAELGQCIELLLISPEFYGEQMALLQSEVGELMEA